MPRPAQVVVMPEAVKAWRVVRGLSQAKLAKKAGVSESLIGLIETRKRTPGLVNTVAIAKALEVEVGAIAIVNDAAAVAEAVRRGS